MTDERAERCRNCMLVRRSGRLCAEHFREFLGWLCFVGPDVETWFWRAPGGERRRLIGLYVGEASPADVVRHCFAKEAA